jgi:transcriptional regulator with XRE-family HTH domain
MDLEVFHLTTFGQRLRDLREKRGLAQKEVGALLDVTISTIGKYESGERTPAPDAIVKLADFFQVSADYLLGRSDIPETVEMRIAKKEDLLGGLPPNAADSIRDYAEFVRKKYKKQHERPSE